MQMDRQETGGPVQNVTRTPRGEVTTEMSLAVTQDAEMTLMSLKTS